MRSGSPPTAASETQLGMKKGQRGVVVEAKRQPNHLIGKLKTTSAGTAGTAGINKSKKKNQPTVHGACFVKQPGTVMESDEFWSGWALLSRLLPGCWCLLQQVGGEDSGQVSQETGGARRGHSESVVEC